MLKILYSLYFIRFQNSTLYSYYKRFCTRFANICLQFYYLLSGGITKNRKIEHNGKRGLIISLTSYPARIDRLWLVIETLLDQTLKPDAIMLWLSRDEFSGEQDLPDNLMKLEKRGLEIYYCDNNLMPHKKYFYVMQKFPGSTVITVDDDMLFHPKLVENLVDCNKKYPNAICCSITRRINFKNGNILPYKKWDPLYKSTSPDFKNHVMGGGGTLFPAESLHPEVFNKDVIEKVALRTDDLWLKAMSLKQNTKVASIAGEYPRYFIPLIREKDNPLMQKNLGENINDKNLLKILNYYGMDFENAPAKK